jgi:hypothetical protein
LVGHSRASLHELEFATLGAGCNPEGSTATHTLP